VIVAFDYVISSSKQTTLALVPFFCHVRFPSYGNHLIWSRTQDKFFGIVAFTPGIPSKQTTLVSVPFFYLA
jgi:hypothetical protein